MEYLNLTEARKTLENISDQDVQDEEETYLDLFIRILDFYEDHPPTSEKQQHCEKNTFHSSDFDGDYKKESEKCFLCKRYFVKAHYSHRKNILGLHTENENFRFILPLHICKNCEPPVPSREIKNPSRELNQKDLNSFLTYVRNDFCSKDSKQIEYVHFHFGIERIQTFLDKLCRGGCHEKNLQKAFHVLKRCGNPYPKDVKTLCVLHSEKNVLHKVHRSSKTYFSLLPIEILEDHILKYLTPENYFLVSLLNKIDVSAK